jgi:3'-phosphoadenosine 5'-phosphosulfate sulfotransferase (PAPS reductase)/FAD synthetase
VPFITYKEIAAQQKRPLEDKIETAVEAIEKGFSVCKSRAAIAFSGGKDSTVLWHLIRTHFPEHAARLAIIFSNTGIEFPESLKFARELGKKWGGDNFYESHPERLKKDELKYSAPVQILEWLTQTGKLRDVLKADGKLKTTGALERACPPEMREKFEHEGLVWKAGTPKSYWWCADQYGFPILGKDFSKLKARRINIDCFLEFSQTSSEKDELKEYYDILKDVKISQACCDILKKNPAEQLQKELKIDVIFKGLMAEESEMRKLNFSTRGYLFKSKRKHLDIPFYHCNPISLWTDANVWEYIHKFDVPYSPLYELTYVDDKGNKCKMKRNGCMGCYTDFGRKNSHMAVLRQTHPIQWKAVMKYGMAREIQKLRSGTAKKYTATRENYYRVAPLLNASLYAGDDYNKFLDYAI